ncbi:MAG: TatD family hydrolase [Lachnospiraceae bacterium]|nr:TatD family hydrolase [Lachnospiraceae bacterium]
MLFDTHAHYDDGAFDKDREEILAGLGAVGVGAVVNVGASLESTRRTLELAWRYPFIYGAVGVHPSECGALTEEDIRWIESLASGKKVVAIGEIGLDYHWEEPERGLQKKWFARQLAMARCVGLPVIIHSRDGAKDTLDILKAEKGEEIGGVVHCFSYTWETARVCLDMGFYLGIGGVATFKNARRLKEVVAYAPLDRLVLETDCPYLAPEPHRGKRNDSRYLSYVAEAVAAIKGIGREQVEAVTWENARRLYRLS